MHGTPTVLWLRRCALLLWTLSWISPTVRSPSGEPPPGFLLVGQAVGVLMAAVAILVVLAAGAAALLLKP